MEALANKGYCLAVLDNYSEAIKFYDKALEINPQVLDIYYNKGISLEYLGNYPEAIKAFDKVIEESSQDYEAWYSKGFSLECLGNYEEALESYDKAIEINPQDSSTWYHKGNCLAHLSNYEEAAIALDKAIEINPQNFEALSLKESILSNPSGLMTSLKAHFSNDDMFVKEDDLLEYAETFLKTYEYSINKSNLTNNDLQLFTFYQGYPYSVNAAVSNVRGASITFIPHSIDENKAIRVSHPIEEIIPKMNEEELNNTRIFLTLHGRDENVSIHDMNFHDAYIYVKTANDIALYDLPDSTPILLADGVYFNGITYIKSASLVRVEKLTFNGTLLLDDSKIIKSNMKK